MLSSTFTVLYIATSFVRINSQAGSDTSPTPAAVQLAPLSSSETVFTSPPADNTLVMAYYPDWVSSTFPPEMIDFSKFHWIDFAFAIPTENYDLGWDDPDMGPALLSRLVVAAHVRGCKVKLSIGGWTGSKYFSPAVATEVSRSIFATNIVATYLKYDLDGIDIDWEYPGHSGLSGNRYTADDTPNFLSFLQLLKTMLPLNAVITAATQTIPFLDSEQQPMKDVSAFASVLDWILLMNYDTWGTTSNPGANAPLYDGCGDASQKDAGAAAAFDMWTSAGFPPNKLVLGLPAYGYVAISDEKKLRTRHHPRQFDSQDEPSLQSDDGGSSGEISFRNLVKQGALVRSVADNSSYVGSDGCERLWDVCSATPYLVCNMSGGTVVSYDDPISIGMKAKFVKEVGMRGVNFWTVNGDTDDCALTNAVWNVFQ